VTRPQSGWPDHPQLPARKRDTAFATARFAVSHWLPYPPEPMYTGTRFLEQVTRSFDRPDMQQRLEQGAHGQLPEAGSGGPANR
jgi:hypothetical protein